MREQELEMLQREKEAEHFKTWEEQEDNFHLQQAKLRCAGASPPPDPDLEPGPGTGCHSGSHCSPTLQGPTWHFRGPSIPDPFPGGKAPVSCAPPLGRAQRRRAQVNGTPRMLDASPAPTAVVPPTLHPGGWHPHPPGLQTS